MLNRDHENLKAQVKLPVIKTVMLQMKIQWMRLMADQMQKKVSHRNDDYVVDTNFSPY